MNDMAWETPEPAGSYDWPEVARELQAHPGQWLKVFDEGPIAVVNAIRQSTITALRPIRTRNKSGSGFEVMTRNNRTGPPKVCTLYLRWVEEG